jgi:hypothetical protein
MKGKRKLHLERSITNPIDNIREKAKPVGSAQYGTTIESPNTTK